MSRAAANAAALILKGDKMAVLQYESITLKKLTVHIGNDTLLIDIPVMVMNYSMSALFAERTTTTNYLLTDAAFNYIESLIATGFIGTTLSAGVHESGDRRHFATRLKTEPLSIGSITFRYDDNAYRPSLTGTIDGIDQPTTYVQYYIDGREPSAVVIIPVLFRFTDGFMFRWLEFIGPVESNNDITITGDLIESGIATYNISAGASRDAAFISVYPYLQVFRSSDDDTVLTEVQNIGDIISDIIQDPSTDPYAPGGTSGPGGGTDTEYELEQDEVRPWTIPVVTASEVGFFTIFNPTIGQLQQLATLMWSPGSIDNLSQTLLKWFESPMDAILGLAAYPVSPSSVGNANIILGNFDTEILAPVVSNQFIELNCGHRTVKKMSDSYLDYEPYTKVDIYLPYVGLRRLDANEIMGKKIYVRYVIDLLSGALTCEIYKEEIIDNETKFFTLYVFQGSCGESIPVTGRNYNDIMSKMVSVYTSAGAVAMGGGAAAYSVAQNAANSIVSAASPKIEKTGNVGGSFMGIKFPYLIITRPRKCIPTNQNKYMGYPSFITVKIDDLSGKGYTVFEEIHIDNIPGTAEEKDEIERILKTGVIL